jgi:hypothetical protein
MAATTTTGFSLLAHAQAVPAADVRSIRRRRISREAGHALDILAHSIEYLTDEFVSQGLAFSSREEQLQAVQILMALNRQIYLECPEIPTFASRCLTLFHRHSR